MADAGRMWLLLGGTVFIVSFCLSHANCYRAEPDTVCTSGFPSQERLTLFATVANPNETFSQSRDRGRQQRVIPGINFTCDGQITKWIVGALWVQKDSGQEYYPELQVWRRGNESGLYILVGTTTIRVAENTTEIYEYTVSPPLEFQYGDVLGIFQPRNQLNLLRVFFANGGSGPINYYVQTATDAVDSPLQELNITGVTSDIALPQVAVEISGNKQKCTCGFISIERLQFLRGDRGTLAGRFAQQRVVPGMKFTCNGYLTKWTVDARWEESAHSFPELQIWRESGDNIYTLVNSTTLYFDAQQASHMYEYNVDPPVWLQVGDVYGIFQPRYLESRLRPLYETDRPLENYFIQTPQYDGSTLAINATSVMTIQERPLVTAEIVVFTPTSPVVTYTSVSPSPELSLRTQLSSESPSLPSKASNPLKLTSTVIISSSSIFKGSQSARSSVRSPLASSSPISELAESSVRSPLASSSPISEVAESSVRSPLASSSPIAEVEESSVRSPLASSSPISKVAESSGGPAPVVYIGAAVGLAFCILLVLVAFLVLGIVFKNQRKKSYMLAIGSTPICNYNPAYEGSNNHQVDGTSQAPHDNVYELSTKVDDGDEREFDNPLYGDVTVANAGLYETVDSSWGVYVPSEEQRGSVAMSVSPSENPDMLLYSTVTVGSSSADVGQPGSFFEESAIYWVPSSSRAELFGQLHKFKYREIWRQQIRVEEVLGSGAYGEVHRGTWTSPTGPVEVAVKTLKEQSSETDRVKFLQEAAIMGQFSHPNVVQLHGVITVGEPFMIIMELMVKGDLRRFLIRQSPSPGELTSENLPRQCLSFSQQIASGMVYLSSKGFVHRDLAARNILLSGDNTCKIADFGRARDLEDTDYYISQEGRVPIKWTALEAINYKKYSTASDVWSYGALLYEIWSLGHKPFQGYENREIVRVVEAGYRLPPPPGCPRDIYQSMINCWHPEAGSRPSFSDLVQSLSRPEEELLKWTEEDTQTHPQAAVLGGPLDAGKNLYPDLQNKYISDS